MTTELFADVAVRARIFNHPRAVYTYQVPSELRSLIEPGMLVWVPLRKERAQGVVLAPHPSGQSDAADAAEQARAAFHIRPIDDVGNPEVRVPDAQLALARWVADYYRVP